MTSPARHADDARLVRRLRRHSPGSSRRPRPRRAIRCAAAPAIIHGEITHRAPRPAANAFTYPAFCLRLPLSQLASLPARGIAHNRRGLVSFHDRDHGAARRHAAAAVDPRAARARRHRGRRRDRAVRVSAHAGLRVQSGQLLGLPRPRRRACARCCARSATRSARRHNYLLAHPTDARSSSGETLTRAQGVPRLAVLRGEGPLRDSAFTSATDAGSRASITSTTMKPRIRCSRRGSPARAAPVEPRAVRGLLVALSLVHARRRRAHPLAGAEAVVEARAVLSPSRRRRARRTTR